MSYSPSLTARTPVAHLRAPSRNSTACLAVAPVSPDTDADLFDGFRRLLANCGAGANRHDQVIVLILACIGAGLDTGPRIIGAARHLGFNPQHTGLILKKHCGRDPARHHWSRDDAGRYVAFV
jgi:hypothetical protein